MGSWITFIPFGAWACAGAAGIASIPTAAPNAAIVLALCQFACHPFRGMVASVLTAD
jgi:hypothetical protein